MTEARIQHRGHCQCCGREQAVRNSSPTLSRMAQHGYTVDNGYFQGVCHGHKHGPIEFDRKQADTMVAMVRNDVIRQGRYLAELKAGTATPGTARSGKRIPGPLRGRMQDEMVPFELAPSHHQADAVRSAVWQTEQRIRSGTQWADDMVVLINTFQGKPLRVVTIEPPPAEIVKGEQRRASVGSERVMTAQYVHGARVHWLIIKADGKKFTGWTGIAAWRKLEKVES